MTRITPGAVWLLTAGLFMPAAHADLYSADAALEKQDLARAFELYRELAELGRSEAQENLAVSYVNGEGVKRDNVLGLGWALIAKENGGSPEMQRLIDQLEPHMKDAWRPRIGELQAQYGKAALQRNVLPVVREGPAYANPGCTIDRPGNPGNYYPPAARKEGVSGSVFLEFTITPDGRAHHPRVLYGIPANVFNEASRAVVRGSAFKPKIENGVAVPCTMRLRLKFTSRGAGKSTPEGGDIEERVEGIRAEAQAGDPRSEMLFGLILTARPDLNAGKERSVSWFIKSAQAGIPTAQFMVGHYTLGGYGVEQDSRKGAAWLTRAANAGQVDAQMALANYLLRGEGGGDTAAAIDWLERAVAAGSRDARYQLAALLATGVDAARRDPQRALTLLDEVMDDVDSDPTAYEIRAAAKAALGKYAEAQGDQKRAVQRARRLGWDVTPQQVRLKTYEDNAAWTGDLFAL